MNTESYSHDNDDVFTMSAPVDKHENTAQENTVKKCDAHNKSNCSECCAAHGKDDC